MNITLANPSQLKATWPRYPKPIHDEIVRRLKTINGAEFDKVERCWWIPVAQADRAMELFPKAEFSVEAIYAATDAQASRAKHFYDSLTHLGIELVIDASGAVCAVGDGVSPLIREEVALRAEALRPLVIAAMAEPKQFKHVLTEAPAEPLTEADESLEPLLKGIQNAAAKEANQYTFEAQSRKRRRKAAKPVQRGLGI